MPIVDLILSLTGVLLWFNWRDQRPSAVAPSSLGLSLLSTIKRAETRKGNRWSTLIGISGLVFIRAVFYWELGARTRWTPTLDLWAIALPFRTDLFLRMLYFSFLSFGLVLGGFYAWLLLLSVINRRGPSADNLQRMLRVQLGAVDRWPDGVKLVLPPAAFFLFWVGFGNTFVALGMAPAPKSTPHHWEQAMVLALGSVLIWKWLLLGCLALHLLNSYVYLGNHTFWNFVNITANKLLWPFRSMPLRVGKVDFSAILGMGLVWLACEIFGRMLPSLYQRISV